MAHDYNPIIPWMGGKRRIATHILAKFPSHTCYVEVFAGSAALFFRKEPAECEVINDINGDIVNLYRVVKNHLEEFIRQFKWALSSRQIFEWHKRTPTEPLTDIQRAARFFYLQKQSFGGKGDNFGTATTSPPKFNLLRIEEELSQAHLRLAGVFIENQHWTEVIQRYDKPHTLFYCDPPYWETAGYGVEFNLSEYEEMAGLARSINGAMIISVNDHLKMREIYSGLNMESISINYTVGGGGGKEAQELIIWNDKANLGVKQPGMFD